MGGCVSTEGGRRGCGRRRRGRVVREGGSSGQGGGSGGVGFRSLSKRSSFGEDELHRIPGRIFLNGASEVACLYTQQGKKGTNQDAMLVWENFASRDDTIFCGIFDGHGPYGHMVAKKVRDSLPLKILCGWRPNVNDDKTRAENNSINGSMNSEETASISLDGEWSEVLKAEESEKFPEMYSTLKWSLLKAFKLMDKELKLHPYIDCFCSGTTTVTLIKQGHDLVIANVGDSRAVLGTRVKDNSLIAVQLTEDMKPNLPREAARIQQCKGRVFSLQDEPEVARVWLPNTESPGLAMARAFGDFCLKDFGLISVPDICYRRLTSKDEFVVLATDGVWDVLSNKEVVDIVASASSRQAAGRALVDCAVEAWRVKFPTSRIDDCAVTCLFFDPSPDASQTLIMETPRGESVAQVSDLVAIKRAEDKVLKPVIARNLGLEPLKSMEFVPDMEIKESKAPERCHSTRSLADCIFNPEEEWSALEGVSRVNSLVNLPRFGSGDRKAGSWRKWL